MFGSYRKILIISSIRFMDSLVVPEKVGMERRNDVKACKLHQKYGNMRYISAEEEAYQDTGGNEN